MIDLENQEREISLPALDKGFYLLLYNKNPEQTPTPALHDNRLSAKHNYSLSPSRTDSSAILIMSLKVV